MVAERWRDRDCIRQSRNVVQQAIPYDGSNPVTWIAAEGPYRGHLLREESYDDKGVLMITREAESITYDPK